MSSPAIARFLNVDRGAMALISWAVLGEQSWRKGLTNATVRWQNANPPGQRRPPR
jgi:hypothetical protein